jgi:hypothetical protein
MAASIAARSSRGGKSRPPVTLAKLATLERAVHACRRRKDAESLEVLARSALVVVADVRRWTGDARKQRQMGWAQCIQELEIMADGMALEASKHPEGSRPRKTYEDKAFWLRDAILVLQQIGTIKLG